MKKSFFLLSAAALMLGMVACSEKDDNLVINNGNGNARVKSVADLVGTEWEYTIGDTVVFGDDYYGYDTLAMTFTVGMNFDDSYAHITFPEDVEILNVATDQNGDYTIEELEELSYIYTYDPTTKTGFLTSNITDEDGNYIQLPFNYDDNLDVITMTINFLYDYEADSPVSLTLNFERI